MHDVPRSILFPAAAGFLRNLSANGELVDGDPPQIRYLQD